MDEIEAGRNIGVGFSVFTMIAWGGSYIFRVATKDMTYAKQLKDYEDAVIAKRLEELDEDEVQALVEDIEREQFWGRWYGSLLQMQTQTIWLGDLDAKFDVVIVWEICQTFMQLFQLNKVARSITDINLLVINIRMRKGGLVQLNKNSKQVVDMGDDASGPDTKCAKIFCKVGGAGLYSVLLFPMLDRPHL